MDFSVQLAEIGTMVTTGAQRLLTMEIPIPDAALLFAFGLLIYAILTNARATASRAHEDVEALYQHELLAANRRAQQARGDLRRAHLMLERERQKRRREENRAVKYPTRAKPAVVDMPKAIKHA